MYEFLLKEYDQVSSAYFGLRTQTSEWFKAYITMVALPLTVVAAILKIGPESKVDVLNLPPIIGVLLLFVAILGGLVSFTIISMRFEMVYYARVINMLRNYYSKQFSGISEYLLLPKKNNEPPYFEAWRITFFQVLTFSIVDSFLFFFGITSIFKLALIWSIIVSFHYLLFHFIVYWVLANARESNDAKYGTP